MFYFGDPTFIILLPALILAFYAQTKVSGTFERYVRVPSQRGFSGADVAREILRQSGIYDVTVEAQPGRLSDHYDPRTRVVRLSSEIYNGRSLAALGVAAHECGHAMQHSDGYAPLAIRNAIVPMAGIGSQMAMPLFLIGLVFRMEFLMTVGIMLFSLAVVFQLFTLPVEYNASKRAVAVLQGSGYIYPDEVGPVKKVLDAAALTYVAATVMSVMQLLRLIILSGGNRRRR